MPFTHTSYEHITLDDKGIPIISGTTMKVVELIVEKLAYGWSPEELHLQHPHLTLGQIYSALAYYFDHQAELDRDIEKRLERVVSQEKEISLIPLVERLKSKRLI
jgi:uncharacterized protein (DUF433 family)